MSKLRAVMLLAFWSVPAAASSTPRWRWGKRPSQGALTNDHGSGVAL